MWFPILRHWVCVHTGTCAPGDVWYNFWSGFGSDLGEVVLIGGIITMVRHHNCGQKWCWRLGKHKYKMGEIEHTLCRKHHPHHSGVAVTAQEIADHAAGS